jgi:hypothetical protein
MAILGPADYRDMRRQLYSPGDGKEELKARPNLPNEAQLKAAFQVFEDFWENNKVSVKASLDTAIGFTTTAALAKKIGRVWLFWKFGQGG